jgi:anti-sigma regulatory factor (Ser/Thr protein kinase)
MVEPDVVGPVAVRLPPDPALSRVLRLAASGIATIAGFTVDEIDDIKIAVSEVLLALIEHGGGDVIDVEFTVAQHAFKIVGRTATDGFDVDHPDLVLSRRVLSGVCTDHGIDTVEDSAEIWAIVAHALIT